MIELGTNAVSSAWFWWCHIADVVLLWNPYGAFFTVGIMLTLVGVGIKRIRGDD
ncbi:MAG: hypothetical protein VCE74_15890 [Alphaproteobacteria bacterium]|jgi:hypothetical protein